MRSVNVAELKNRLSKYLTYAKAGEEIIIRDRNLPVAKLIPFSWNGAGEEDLLLAAQGQMRLPQEKLDLRKFYKISVGRVTGNKAIRALRASRNDR